MNATHAAQLEPIEPVTLEGEAAQSNNDLLEVMRAYNQVTEQLRKSHETLTGQVVRLQQELASANAALQRSKRLAALGEMAAGIAHEIRNPLASMQLYTGMLIEDLADRVAQQDVARRINEAVRGLNAVVGDVLTFSREMRLNLGPLCIEATVTRAIDAVRPLLNDGEIDAVIDCGDQEVEADGDLLHQALVNLFRNAAQAMDGVGTLSVTAAPHDAGVAIVVRDTGPGIAAEQIDRIFNPFFTTRHTGTGLGLAIVHRIIDAHGGSIAVHNDGGAVFTLTLPTSQAAAGQASPDDERKS